MATAEPMCFKAIHLEPVLHDKRSPHTAAGEQPSLAATRESPHASVNTQYSQKINFFNYAEEYSLKK